MAYAGKNYPSENITLTYQVGQAPIGSKELVMNLGASYITEFSAISGGAKVHYLDPNNGIEKQAKVTETPAALALLSGHHILLTPANTLEPPTWFNTDRIHRLFNQVPSGGTGTKVLIHEGQVFKARLFTEAIAAIIAALNASAPGVPDDVLLLSDEAPTGNTWLGGVRQFWINATTHASSAVAGILDFVVPNRINFIGTNATLFIDGDDVATTSSIGTNDGANDGGAGTGGNGEGIFIRSGGGGTSVTGTGGIAGQMIFGGNTGGDTSGAAGTGGGGHSTTIQSGDGGDDLDGGSGNGGNGGSLSLTAGIGGTGNTPGVDGVIRLIAGSATIVEVNGTSMLVDAIAEKTGSNGVDIENVKHLDFALVANAKTKVNLDDGSANGYFEVTTDNGTFSEPYMWIADVTASATRAMEVYLAGNEALFTGTGGDIIMIDTEIVEVKKDFNAEAAIIFDGTTITSGPGAVAITGSIHELTSTATGNAMTLADGAEGQRLAVVYVAEAAGADTLILTPTNLAGASTTITFNAIGDTADLLFTAGTWFVMGGSAVVA